MTTTHHDARGRALFRYTADMVVFYRDDVLLIERGTDPFKGLRAFPGGHVAHDENSREAAVRELAEETGVHVRIDHTHRVGVYDAPGRDPRGPVVATVYAVSVPQRPVIHHGDDAARAVWVDVETALEGSLAFDHHDALNDAYSLLLIRRLDHY
ncbi:NUDIX domain-containing protein [Glycomyces paridis]|uniref:NUDIX hydrolase n=1 Tax=Glycomyces paridis TaxID=2126555 RepID=A0A4S8PM86_9ACTN|nr:NUDIX hydrolase [Glycomyces paridis]THV29639.1 NUDIX hydrolase [Glycomyces paridis]